MPSTLLTSNHPTPIQPEGRALLLMTGRITRLGMSRWAGPGGSYRTIQRFFATVIPWGILFWVFFRHHVYCPGDVYLVAGDEVIVTKAGTGTHGLDRFLASLYGKPVKPSHCVRRGRPLPKALTGDQGQRLFGRSPIRWTAPCFWCCCAVVCASRRSHNANSRRLIGSRPHIVQGKGRKDRRVYMSPDLVASRDDCLAQHPGDPAQDYRRAGVVLLCQRTIRPPRHSGGRRPSPGHHMFSQAARGSCGHVDRWGGPTLVHPKRGSATRSWHGLPMCRSKSVPHTRGNDAALAHASAEGQASGEQAPGRRRTE